MDYPVIFALFFVGVVLFASGFFVGRAERESSRMIRITEPSEHGRAPL